MQLVLGPYQRTQPGTDVSWRTLRDAEPDMARLFRIQLSVSLTFGVLVLWVLARPDVDLSLFDEWTLVAVCAALALLHELAHAAAFPRSRDAAVILDFRPSQLLFSARYTGVLSRSRYVTMLAMPLLLLSLAPIAAFARAPSVPVDVVVASLLNALVSGGDILAAILALAQVPASGSIRMERDRIAWRAPPLARPLRPDD